MSRPTGNIVRSLEHFGAEIEEAESTFGGVLNRFLKKRPDLAQLAHQADWHLRGVIYHTRNVLRTYSRFADEVASRAMVTDKPPAAIVMYAPDFQTMMFDFYALVNLTRITLDNLRLFLRPVFKNQIPKSITDVLKGTTDCPVYENLAKQPIVTYLCDLRNCLVHYRTFATSDNAVVFEEHLPEADKLRLFSGTWFDPMARAYFRRVGDGVSVNIYLPDSIFDPTRPEKLVEFTYVQRFNLLSQSREFMRLIAHCIRSVYLLLLNPGTPTYSFEKVRRQ